MFQENVSSSLRRIYTYTIIGNNRTSRRRDFELEKAELEYGL